MNERFSFLQRKEIELGHAHGLSDEDVEIYSTGTFNYQQMSEIRKALEQGIKKESVRLFAHPDISSEDMKEIAEALMDGEEVKERKTNRHIPSWIFPCCIAVIISLFVMYWMISSIRREDVYLELKQSEIRLSAGQLFEPEKYIRIYGGEQANLTLPESGIIEYPGTYLKTYAAESNGSRIQKILRVVVVDDIHPQLVLTEAKITMQRNSRFDCRFFIESAMDNVDGDLRNKVRCSNTLTDEENQKVSYAVEDAAGNTTEAWLEITLSVVEPPEDNDESEPVVKTEIRTEIPKVPTMPVTEPEHQKEEEYEYFTEERVEEIWSEPLGVSEVVVEHFYLN